MKLNKKAKIVIGSCTSILIACMATASICFSIVKSNADNRLYADVKQYLTIKSGYYWEQLQSLLGVFTIITMTIE